MLVRLSSLQTQFFLISFESTCLSRPEFWAGLWSMIRLMTVFQIYSIPPLLLLLFVPYPVSGGCDRSCQNSLAERINVHVLPHSHDDVGWLKTVGEGKTKKYHYFLIWKLAKGGSVLSGKLSQWMVLGNSKGRGKINSFNGIVVLFSIYKRLHNIYEDYSDDNNNDDDQGDSNGDGDDNLKSKKIVRRQYLYHINRYVNTIR